MFELMEKYDPGAGGTVFAILDDESDTSYTYFVAESEIEDQESAEENALQAARKMGQLLVNAANKMDDWTEAARCWREVRGMIPQPSIPMTNSDAICWLHRQLRPDAEVK
jgi:hypothetical protein